MQAKLYTLNAIVPLTGLIDLCMEKNKKTIRPYIVDVEASGFGSQSYPIEIGLALGPDTRYCSLIIPSPQWTHWDKAAEKTHAISRDLLARFCCKKYFQDKEIVQA
ncbi:MAG: hypothetical protein HUN05_02695 [Desulfobacter sp.]|nr:MAG: hypothetical protein HUN05_02695 [Desulfobacter sp.]